MVLIIVLINLVTRLAKAEVNSCVEEWEKILNPSKSNETIQIYQDMKKFSGFSKNNLGDYEACNKLQDSKYVLLRFFNSPVNVQSFCGPKSCNTSDYINANELGLQLIYNSSYEIFFPKQLQEEKYQSYPTGSLLMIAFTLLILLACTLSGVLDYFQKSPPGQNSLSSYFACFSLWSNTKSLFKPAAVTDSFRHTGFLNANKVLSISWIIMAHTFQYHYYYPALINIDEAFETTKNLLYPFIYGALYAVDTFFWGVGFGLTFHCLEELVHHKHVPVYKTIGHLLLNRYLFLSATYFFFVFFFWKLQVFMGSGPIWVDLEKSVLACDDYWYANILYLNVYIPDFRGNTCLVAGWYISNDIQFLIVVLALSYVFYRYGENTAFIAIMGLITFCMFLTYTVVSSLDLSASFFSAFTGQDFYYFYYIKPYSRIAPCLFGITCAIITRAYIDNKEHEHKQPLIAKVNRIDYICLSVAEVYNSLAARIISFLLGLLGLGLLISVSYDVYDNPGRDDSYSHWAKSDHYLFLTLEKVVFGLSLSLLLLPVALGHFRPIGQIMSSYPFIVLGRLNYCTFLIHNSLIEIWYKSQKTSEVFNTWTNLVDTAWFILICELFAIPTVLFVEMPVMNLYGLIKKRE